METPLYRLSLYTDTKTREMKRIRILRKGLTLEEAERLYRQFNMALGYTEEDEYGDLIVMGGIGKVYVLIDI